MTSKDFTTKKNINIYDKFGRLTVVKEAGKASNYTMRYFCRCDCGGDATVRKGRLLSGETTSCGCKQIIDMVGYKSGILTVIKKDGIDNWGQTTWLCKCKCGGEITLAGGILRNNRTDNCGCLTSGRLSKAKTTHGKYYSREYKIWAGMKTRCDNKDDDRYGGKGITYCAEWEMFENFYNDMGDIPSDCREIDRKDNNKGYSKENCRWTTRKINMENTSKSRVWTVRGIDYQSMTDAIKATGMSRWRIQDRCHRELEGFSTRLKYTS